MTAKQLAQLYRNQGIEPPADVLSGMPRQSKMRNVKTEVDGIMFDSELESRVYRILKLWERSGIIRDLVLQPPFELQAGFRDADGEAVRAIQLIGDFGFFHVLERRQRYVDAKGRKTAVFRLKHKLLKRHRPDVSLELWTKATVRMYGG